MEASSLVAAKHIFIDVVEFTKARPVEAQVDIVTSLNQMVKASIQHVAIDAEHVIFLPTGDGLCVVLLDIGVPPDLHLQLALEIVRRVRQAYDATADPSRRFLVRTGVNASTDNLLTDINGRRNIAGAGINICQRVMSLADGGQILVGRPVYDDLSHRERYLGAFRHYRAEVKHGEPLDVYQYTNRELQWLDNETPANFCKTVQARPTQAQPSLPELVAYYLLEAAQSTMLASGIWGAEAHALVVTYYFRAVDAAERRKAPAFESPAIMMPEKAGTTVADQHRFFAEQDDGMVIEFASLIAEHHLAAYGECFASAIMKRWCVPSEEGLRRLEADWPELFSTIEAIRSDTSPSTAGPSQRK